MKFLLLLACLLFAAVMVISMPGCGPMVGQGPPPVLTPPAPVQLYNAVDFGRSVFMSVAGIRRAEGKITDADWAAIQQADQVTVKAQSDALVWMQANPTLANTPGAQVPGYSPASLLADAFGVFAKKYGIVLPQPITIPVPTTQP